MNTVHTTNTQPRSGFGLLDVPDPPPLPKNSVIDRFFLESPVTAIILVLVVGLVAWLKLRHTALSSRGILAIAVCVAIAAVLGVVAAVVKTSAEILRDTTT